MYLFIFNTVIFPIVLFWECLQSLNNMEEEEEKEKLTLEDTRKCIREIRAFIKNDDLSDANNLHVGLFMHFTECVSKNFYSQEEAIQIAKLIISV